MRSASAHCRKSRSLTKEVAPILTLLSALYTLSTFAQNIPPPPTLATYEVTAYSVGDDFTPAHGITASGKPVREGVTAACPRDHPFGTRVMIPELGRTLTCLDRGGRITSRKLDVYIANKAEALRFGRRMMPIIIFE
ncbi:3D domain-containing protein [Brevibacillus brevis]|uniref:3D domain-containing protein n=1 Tax=Brevibacillus brevis TaxID=1393 RepID=UPI003AF51F68